ncbi:gametocyte-specific factor 1-like protein [Leptotrombidium deliense]|uniref:Gametocyte-specific factor 1-like protein n=1 Tax=Leptotrombidium deliense TaxID=299467 RepID=A0A443S0A3_9ACAR|nr:gametocyte-specific factor 1-like protein [Leptotrombidium deliense]
MATFIDDQEELWKKCPFNPIHCVSKRRYAVHLLKCPDRNRKGMICCPYNIRHRIEEHEFHNHIQVCEDRNQYLRSAVEEHCFKKETGKCYLYESSEKSFAFEDDDFENNSKKYEEYALSIKDDSMTVVIPGLQEKVEAEMLAEKLEKMELIPSAVAVQRLPKMNRKKLHKLLIALKKTKQIEAENELGKEEKYDFYKEWDVNFIDKQSDFEKNTISIEKQNIETKVSNIDNEFGKILNIDSDEENDAPQYVNECLSTKIMKPNIPC